VWTVSALPEVKQEFWNTGMPVICNPVFRCTQHIFSLCLGSYVINKDDILINRQITQLDADFAYKVYAK